LFTLKNVNSDKFFSKYMIPERLLDLTKLYLYVPIIRPQTIHQIIKVQRFLWWRYSNLKSGDWMVPSACRSSFIIRFFFVLEQENRFISIKAARIDHVLQELQVGYIELMWAEPSSTFQFDFHVMSNRREVNVVVVRVWRVFFESGLDWLSSLSTVSCIEFRKLQIFHSLASYLSLIQASFSV
jgi:hypothetical protein